MSEITFAQICKNVSSIEEKTSKILDLYSPDIQAVTAVTEVKASATITFAGQATQSAEKLYVTHPSMDDAYSLAGINGDAPILQATKFAAGWNSDNAAKLVATCIARNGVLTFTEITATAGGVFGGSVSGSAVTVTVASSVTGVVGVVGVAFQEKIPKEIKGQEFINLFYSLTEEGVYEFNMNLDASSAEVCISHLNLPTWYEKNNSSLFEVAEKVPGEYGRMMGLGMECFDTCSLMKLRSELLELEDLCKACQNKSVICCSLSLDEIIDILNDGDGAGRVRASDAAKKKVNGANGNTGIDVASSETMLLDDDKLAFSVLITNPSAKVDDIELKLHFKIKN